MTSWMAMKSLPPLKADEPYPLFNRVSIETVGRCTRKCFFCPSRLRTQEQQGDMSDEVFNALFEQLQALDFEGALQMFYLGEPLLDKKLVDRVRHARRCCPRSRIMVVSNGDLVREPEQFNELFDAGLNLCNVDCYDVNVFGRVAKVSDAVDATVDVTVGERVLWRTTHNSRQLNVVDVSDVETTYHNSFHDYLVPEVHDELAKRGMLRPRQPRFCAMPHRRLVVWWTGEVVLCCVTTPVMKRPIVVGSYRDVLAAWNSKTMQTYRWHLQRGEKVGQCKACVHSHAYSHAVRRIKKP